MKSHWFRDGKKGRRVTVSMTEKEALYIYDCLIGRNCFSSHKLRQILFDFFRAGDVFVVNGTRQYKSED